MQQYVANMLKKEEGFFRLLQVYLIFRIFYKELMKTIVAKV